MTMGSRTSLAASVLTAISIAAGGAQASTASVVEFLALRGQGQQQATTPKQPPKGKQPKGEKQDAAKGKVAKGKQVPREQEQGGQPAKGAGKRAPAAKGDSASDDKAAKRAKRERRERLERADGALAASESQASTTDSESERDLTPARARAELDGVLCFLVAGQNEDGSWGVDVPDDLNELGFALDSYYAWNQAANALVIMALMDAPASEERDRALRHGLDWLCRTRLAHRGSNWDVDSTWASLYGFVCLVQASQDARFDEPELRDRVQRRGLEYYADLVERQTPDGGWAYYDDPPFTATPKWATSFCTALVLPALLDARDLGWPIDPELIERALQLVQRCALPNGAYSYSFDLVRRGHGGVSINQVPGSLGRIQVCNWALARAGDERVTDDLVREGLEQFFEQHAYLDMARTRPVPHEGWFANAGYFYFFGHYYAAKAISLLPPAERELWHRRLRFHITKTLSDEGSCSDFMSSTYQVNAGSGFAALVLAAGLPVDGAAVYGPPMPETSAPASPEPESPALESPTEVSTVPAEPVAEELR